MTRPRRITVILLLGCLAGAGLFVFQRYLDNPNSDINRFVPASWLNKARLATIVAHFPAGTPLPPPSGKTSRPDIDRNVPAHTETALFALG